MLDFRHSLINSTFNNVLQGLHYPLEVMLTCVRWYMAYPFEPAPCGVNDAIARCLRRPLHRASLGDVDLAGVGRSCPSAQTNRGLELANGQDLHQGRGSVEILVPRRRQDR